MKKKAIDILQLRRMFHDLDYACKVWSLLGSLQPSWLLTLWLSQPERKAGASAKNWVKGGYHGGIQLIWGNCEWADAPGMRGQEGTGRCYTRRTVRWATGILASNGKADMASSKLRYWSWFHVCMCIQSHISCIVASMNHEIKIFFLYIYMLHVS